MNIYEIDRAITDLVDAETGEIIDIEALAALQMERDQKIENVACWYKNEVGDAEKIDAEIKSLTARRDSAKKRAESLKKYLSDALFGAAWESPKAKISYRKSTGVQIEDEQKFIEWAVDNRENLIVYKDPTISKKAVGDALKSGEEIPGATLYTANNISIR